MAFIIDVLRVCLIFFKSSSAVPTPKVGTSIKKKKTNPGVGKLRSNKQSLDTVGSVRLCPFQILRVSILSAPDSRSI